MKYLKNNLKFYTAAVLFAVSAMFTSYTLKADDLEHIIMPDANIIGRINLKNINNSSIIKYIKTDKTVSSELKVDELNKILNKYGLSDQDFPSLVFALKINLDKIKNLSEGLADNNAKEFVFGLNSTKKVSLDKLKNIIIDASKNDNSNDVKVKVEKKDGVSLLLVIDDDKTKEQPLAVTVLSDGKLIVGGSVDTVINTVKRIQSGKVDTLSAKLSEIKSHVSKKADVYLIGYLQNELRDKLGLKYEQSEARGKAQKNPNGEVFKDINAILLEAVFQKKLNVDIVAYFVNKSSAEEGSIFVNQYIPMLRFMVLGMTKGKQIPLMNTIECNAVKSKPELKLNFSFSEKDVDAIQELVKQNKNNAPQGLSEFNSN